MNISTGSLLCEVLQSFSAKVLFAIATLFLLLPPGSAAQSKAGSIDGAKAVLEQFIELNSNQKLQTPQARKLLTGEALKLWDTPTFGTLTTSPDKMVMIGADRAVGRVQWYLGDREWVTDYYFYLVFEKEWRIEAMRCLAAIGVLGMLYAELQDKPKRSPEEEYLFNQIKLTLQPDEFLRSWFAENKKELERLRKLALGMKTPASVSVDSTEKGHSQIVAKLKKIYPILLEKKDDQSIQITIGGITDNSVGFLYSPSDIPPPISPSDFIWIERVSKNWYLFRTT